MPKRRRLRSGVSDAASSLSQVMAMLLQGKMVDSRMAKTQEAMDTRAAAGQRATLESQQLNDFNTSTTALMDPEKVRKFGPQAQRSLYDAQRRRLPANLQSLAGDVPDFDSLDSSYPERMAGLAKELEGVTSAEDPRLTAEGLRKKAPSFRVNPMMDIPNLMPGSAGTSSGAQVEDPAFTEIIQMAERQKGALTAERNRTTAREAVTDAATGMTSFLTEEEQGQRGAVKTGLTPAEEAAKAGGITTAQQAAQEGVTNDPANQRARARGAAMEAGSRRRAEVAAELSSMGITGQQQSGALQLADDFEREAAPFTDVRRNYQQIAKLAAQGTAAGDVGLIYGYMKILDPGAAVQEGDKANATNAAGIPDRIVQAYNKAIAGDALAPDVRSDFVRTARTIYNAAEADHQDTVKTYTDRATTLRVPPSLVVREIAPPRLGPDAAGAAPGAGGSALDVVRSRSNRIGGPGPRGN